MLYNAETAFRIYINSKTTLLKQGGFLFLF